MVSDGLNAGFAEWREKAGKDGVAAPVIRSGAPIDPAADVIAGLRENCNCWGNGKVEADWLVYSGLRDALISRHREDLERALRRGVMALDDDDALFHPVDEKGVRLSGDDVGLVTALVCVQRAWGVCRAVYRRGAAPLFVTHGAWLIEGKPQHLDQSGEVTLADPRRSPTTQRTLVTVGDWDAALSGYAHRLMTRPRTPTPRQLERELRKEGLDALDLAKAAAYIADGGLDDLAFLLEDDDEKKPTADVIKYYKIIWNGHGVQS